METPLKLKIKFILTMLISTVTVVVFSFLFALAAQTATIKAGVEIEYYAGEGVILINGDSFSDQINKNCTEIIFDYYTPEKYDVLISGASQSSSVAVNGKGYANGGITMFYGGLMGTVAYVLSKDEIFANKNCKYMFYKVSSNLESIEFNNFNTSKTEDMSYMFYSCDKLISLDLQKFNTSEVTTMEKMFQYCPFLKSINLISFNTQKVTNMNNMFAECKALQSLNLSSFNTSNVTDMSTMFYYCETLEELDLSNFNTENVEGGGMSEMFYVCKGLKKLTLSSNFKTEKVTSMFYMFSKCESLEELDLSSFNTSNVAGLGMACMFEGCKNLTKLNLGNNFNTSQVTDMASMFYDCRKLESLDLSGFATSNVTDMRHMFAFCPALTNLDLSSFNTENVTNMGGMFYDCYKLKTIYVSSKWSTSKITAETSGLMFNDCYDLVGGGGTEYSETYINKTYAKIDETNSKGYLTASYSLISGAEFSDLITLHAPENIVFGKYSIYSGAASQSTLTINGSVCNVPGKDKTRTEDIKIYVSTTSNVKSFHVLSDSPIIAHEDCSELFKTELQIKPLAVDLTLGNQITNITFSNFNTYNTTKMDSMFSGCSKLSSISLNRFDTSKVTSMNSMFNNCSELTSLSTSYLKTDVVTDMSSMFSGCSKLTSLTFGTNFKTENCLNMRSMFYNCSGLTSLNLTNFKTINVTTMSSMFSGCSALTSLTLGANFKTDNCLDIGGMFTGCKLLTQIPTSNFVTSKVTSMAAMFRNCSSLTSLDLSTFSTEETTSMINMFNGCTSLQSVVFGKNFKTKKVTNMQYAFQNCSTLVNLDLSSFNIDKVTIMSSMFYGCTDLETIRVNGNWKVGSSTSGTTMFTGCVNLVGKNGTECAVAQVYDKSYARIDRPLTPGYLTIDDVNMKSVSFKSLISDCESIEFDYFNEDEHLNLVAAGNSISHIDVDSKGYDDGGISLFYNSDNKKAYVLSEIDINVTSLNGTFKDLSSLKTIDFNNFYLSDCYDADFAFQNCSSLTSLDLSKWVMGDDVASMEYMFSGCSELQTLDLFAVLNVNSAYFKNMFKNCTKLTGDIDVRFWGINTVYSAEYMFANCTNITEVYLPSFDFYPQSTASHLQRMFYGCENLTTCNISGMTTKYHSVGADYMFAKCWELVDLSLPEELWLNDCSGMFYDCKSLEELSLGKWDVSSVKEMDSMFANCYLLNWLSLTWFDSDTWETIYWDTSSVTTMESMFEWCSSLVELDLSNWNTGKVEDMSCLFSSCRSLVVLDLYGWKTDKVEDMSYMFYGCMKLKWNTDEERLAYNIGRWDVSYVVDMSYMFAGCKNLTSLDLLRWDVSNVNHMERMFGGCGEIYCENLKQLNISGWDTSSLFSTRLMFEGCSSLTSLDLSGWNTNKLYDMEYMFSDCLSLTTLNLEGFVSGAGSSLNYDRTYLEGMFWGCSSLTDLNIDGWDTSNVTDMSDMFYKCSSLTSLDLSGWDTSRVSTMNEMFYECSSLLNLDFYGWNVESLKYMSGMFRGCTNLLSINFYGWKSNYNIGNMNDMFLDCESLTELDLSWMSTNSDTYVWYMFAYCSNLTTIYVGDGWSGNFNQGKMMFFMCSNLKGDIAFDSSYIGPTYATYEGGYLTYKKCEWL